MGCDIHLHIEVKLNGKWEHYGAPNVSRWYLLFEKMAGVRGEPENAISLPKGLPDDLTTLTRYSSERWDGDGHSHSWLGIEEIMLLEDWLKTQKSEWRTHSPDASVDLEHHVLHTYLFGNSFTGPKRYPEDDQSRPGVEDVRFVFWFDN
jgi:hypothetical protein